MNDGTHGSHLPGDTQSPTFSKQGGVCVLGPCYSECSPRAGRVGLGIVWEPVRNSKSQARLSPADTGACVLRCAPRDAHAQETSGWADPGWGPQKVPVPTGLIHFPET